MTPPTSPLSAAGALTAPASLDIARSDTVPPVSLATTAYQQLKQALDDFHYVPGDRFSENEVSERLHMSRSPVREALFRLQREGYISVTPKLGWLVNPIDFAMFEQLYDVRAVLECAAVDRLCEMEDLAPRIAPLQKIWCVPPEQRLTDAPAVSRQDEEFHATLVAASGNQQMARIHQDITDRIRIVRRLEFTRGYRIEVTYDEHRQIIDSLLARKRDQTRMLLQAHIAVSRAEVKKITLFTLHEARQRVTGRSEPNTDKEHGRHDDE